MTIFKNKKINNIIIICITLLSLLELYFIYKITMDYRGIYKVSIFFSAFISQSFSYIRLLKKEIPYPNFRFIIIVLLSLFLPLMTYFTLPNYTYNEGKQIVQRYLQSSGNPIFIDFPKNKDTVPLANNSERLFVSNRAYCYGIKSTINNKYFMVNPLTGKLVQLSEYYW